jgi:hypothetical protein
MSADTPVTVVRRWISVVSVAGIICLALAAVGSTVDLSRPANGEQQTTNNERRRPTRESANPRSPGATQADRYLPPAGSPLARREHPRIWITRENVPSFQRRLAGEFKLEYQAFVAHADSTITRERGRTKATAARRPEEKERKSAQRAKKAAQGPKPGRARQSIERPEPEPAGNDPSALAVDLPRGDVAESLILNYAFIYRIGDVPGVTYGRPLREYGERAKTLLLDAASLSTVNKASYWPAVAYDWLHDLLSPDERLQVWRYLKAADQKLHSIKDPWDDRSSRSVQRRILAGLAFWGDGIDDAAAGTLLGMYQTHVLNGGMLDGANLIAADDGGVSEGFSYAARGGESSTMENLIKVLEGWRTGNGLTREEVFGGSAATSLRYFPQWVAYLIRPFAVRKADRPGGYEFLAYKTHLAEPLRAVGSRGPLRQLISELRLFKEIDPDMAALSEWLLQNRIGPLENTTSDLQERALLGHFIFGHKGIPPRSPRELGLPLTKVFDGLGWVVMRTGWDSLSDSMVTFMASPWRRSAYSNLNQNSFTIDRRGPLALNAGHRGHHSYANSTWSHNTIIFPDPSENPDADGMDLGAQRRGFKPVVTASTMLQRGSIYDLGGLKRVQAAEPATGLDFDYVYGDATRAYNGPANSDRRNSPKVKLFTRQFVYFRPGPEKKSDRIVVFDRTETTDARFEKRWLLHTSGDPQIDGVEKLEREGKWVYEQAGLVTATNTAAGSAGRLFSRTLLPLARRLVKIGGPGHEFEDPYGRQSVSKGYDPRDEYVAQYVGNYRVEVIPAKPSTSDVFLHVLEATDADSSPATPTALLQGTGLVAARVGDRIAAFNPLEAPLAEGSIVVDQPGSYKLLVCDLNAGREYDVTWSTGSSRVKATAAGLGYVDVAARAGERVTVRITGRVAAGQ